jgi:hypothetical protein
MSLVGVLDRLAAAEIGLMLDDAAAARRTPRQTRTN